MLLFPLTINASGTPSLLRWFVKVGSSTETTNLSRLTFFLPVGDYNQTVYPTTYLSPGERTALSLPSEISLAEFTGDGECALRAPVPVDHLFEPDGWRGHISVESMDFQGRCGEHRRRGRARISVHRLGRLGSRELLRLGESNELATFRPREGVSSVCAHCSQPVYRQLLRDGTPRSVPSGA